MTNEQAEKIRAEAKRLRESGHVVQLEEVFTHDYQLERLQIHHLLTCAKCREGK